MHLETDQARDISGTHRNSAIDVVAREIPLLQVREFEHGVDREGADQVAHLWRTSSRGKVIQRRRQGRWKNK